MVVDGIEGKQYDDIGAPIFSQDSQRVAYAAEIGDKCFVVVDGIEGKQYDAIKDIRERIIFDSPDSLHYLAAKGNSLYLVEETIIPR